MLYILRRMCSQHTSPNVLAEPAEWARGPAEWARGNRRMGSQNPAAERARASRPRKHLRFKAKIQKRAHSAAERARGDRRMGSNAKNWVVAADGRH